MGEPETEAAEAAADAPAEGTAPPDWMARCEILQARIEVLEHQVEALMLPRRTNPAPPQMPDRFPDFPSAPREARPPAEPPERVEVFAPLERGGQGAISRAMEPLDEAPAAEVILRKVQSPAPEIGVLVSAGDPAGRKLAENLTEILARLGWRVRDPAEDTVLAKSCRGLTLAAPPTLPLPRVTGTLNALREAGYAMTFQLDPGRGLTGAVLIVGTGAGSGN